MIYRDNAKKYIIRNTSKNTFTFGKNTADLLISLRRFRDKEEWDKIFNNIIISLSRAVSRNCIVYFCKT